MTKKLYRAQSSKMLGGICAGLAQYLEVDSTLIRLIFVAVGLLTAIFPMLIFYVIAWIIIPVREEVEQIRKQEKSNKKK